jgi:hypothetical protein
MICIAHQYYSGGQVKGGLDVWYEWRRRAIHITFWCGNVKERIHLEDLGVDGLMALRYIIRKGSGVDWINLVQNKERWRVPLITVFSFRVP